MKKAGGFGSAKPLPGQSNYGMSEADLLERQAREMEERLKSLQQKMQDTAPAPAAGAGGSLWKNSRPEKGSVTAYAKDYQEKLKAKKHSDKAGKATAEGRRLARQKSQAHFSEKAANLWSVADVAEWLGSKNLSQYAPNFQQNEINGSVLMDISLEDLDYMGITILGHRKTILKGIEEISSGKVKQIARAPEPARAAVSSSVDCSAVAKADAKPPVHWSQLEPIANNDVTEAEGSTFVNPADTPMDEEAERRAFAEAVMEWRNMGKGTAETATTKNDSGMWSNPIVDSSPAATVGNVGVSSSGAQPVARAGGGSLADGELDEEKERIEFAKAVEAWRNGGKSASEGTGTTGAAVSSGSSVAEKLAKSMEAEHERVVAQLLEEQELARRKISEAARELEVAKQRKLDSEQKAKMEDDAADAKYEEKKEAMRNENEYPGNFDDSDSDDKLSEASEDGDHSDDAKAERGTVVVSLVESTMGLDINLQAEEKECQYVVDEASDDDEEEKGGNNEEKY